MSHLAPRPLAAAFAVLVFSLVSSLAQAQSPALIYACVHKSSEQVRIVPATEECKSTETRVTWNLPGGSITGQVVSCSGGVAAALVYLAGESFTAVTGDNGGFRISNVPPGTYDLVAEATSGASVARPGVTVSGGAATPVGTLTIDNLLTDPAHCGTCGNACAAGHVCVAGQCTLNCVGGTTHCGDACVNTASDAANCGACGTACPAGQVCSSGQCTLSCAGGTTLCGGACVNTTNDALHCGSCQTVCAGGQSCVASQCTLVCSVGLTRCGNLCVDIATSTTNCGMCGSVCPSGNSCASGVCVSTSPPTCGGVGICAGTFNSVTGQCNYPSATTVCGVSNGVTSFCNGLGQCVTP